MSPETHGGLADRKPTYSFPEKDGIRLLGELILYIGTRCAADPTFGAVKLNKLLWWADFLFYARTGEPITGVKYQKLPAGPAPVPLKPVRDTLIERGDAEIVSRRYYSKVQMRLVPLREARTDEFSENQLRWPRNIGQVAKVYSTV